MSDTEDHEARQSTGSATDRRFNEESRKLAETTRALADEIALRKRTEEALARAEATLANLREENAADVETRGHLDAALDALGDAFALFDQDDKLLLCNSAYRRLVTGAGPGPLAGRSYGALMDTWTRDIAFVDKAECARFRGERLERRDRDRPATFDVRMRDGRHLRVVDRHTAENGIVQTIADVTDDFHMAEALREARSAADAANGAKSEFIFSMSHEIRTPLNSILGFAQLLVRDKKDQLSDRHKLRVGQILSGGEHLRRLIDDILDLSRIEAGGVSMSTEPVSVLDVLDEVTRTLEPMAAGRRIRVDAESFPADPGRVTADRTRLAQVLMNLGSNAIKYNEEGGQVMFTVLTPRPGYVRVAVRDTGIGIPTDKQDTLFRPFQRAGQETGTIEGTGIGLVITRRLARLMKGDVGFRSVPGEGSEFWVDIPAHDGTA